MNKVNASSLNQDFVNAYCKAKDSGLQMGKALFAVVDAGGTIQEAQTVCWAVEKGTAAPAYGLYADGREQARHEASQNEE